LQYLLYSQIELAGLGTVFDAPIDVQLSPHDIVQLDLVMILKDSVARVTPSKIIGETPIDERVGVQEFWIVDPFENRVTQLVINDGKYQEQSIPETELRLRSLPQVVIPLKQIW
jgi:hypothetical protein